MSHRADIAVVLTLCMSVLVCQVNAQEDVDAHLSSLEKLSTTDFDSVREQLAKLNLNSLTPDQRARVSLLQAHQLLVAGDANTALPFLESVITSNDVSPKYRLRAQTHTAHLLSDANEHESAFDAIYKGLELLPDVDDPIYVFGTLHSAGSLHFDIGAYSEALEYGQRALAIATDRLAERDKCFALQVAVGPTSRLDRPDAQEVMERAVMTCEEAGEPIPLRNVLIYYSEWLIHHNRNEEALEKLEAAKAIGPEVAVFHDFVHIHTLFAEAQLRRGLIPSAKDHAKQALQLAGTADHLNLRKRERDAHDILGRIGELEGNLETALYHQRAASKAEEVWRNDSRTRLNAMLAARYHTLDQAYQIEQANRLLELERQIAKSRENLIYTIAIAALILFALGFMWLQKLRTQKKAFQSLSERDSLTGIFNRRRILAAAKACFDESVVEGWAMSIVLLDLDEFKSINDRFGHQAGDWALVNVCDALAANLRERDQFGRTGGEEFLLLLPNTKAGKAAEIAEACRTSIERLDSSASGASFNVTGSFGVAEIGDFDASFEELLSRCDQALYRAKNAGRNRVEKAVAPDLRNVAKEALGRI